MSTGKQTFVISALDARERPVEVVERKGLGHPDTICDALAEALSRRLCREYRARFGDILHHNVDKVLLRGGSAAPAFGGGRVLAPIDIYLSGRAVAEAGGARLPIDEFAVEESRSWLRAHLKALDADRDVEVHPLVRPGSLDLQELFSRRLRPDVPLANDTAAGVGFAPMSPLERLVLAVERQINGLERGRAHPAWGEDVKVMGIRCGGEASLTIACAMIGRHLGHVDDYLEQKAAIGNLARTLAAEQGFADCAVAVNAADDAERGAVYLTVTGTSAEAGDDGEAGRGNRVNGLITPCRPMILEAVAGKNPATHVGKIYNVIARDMAGRIVAEEPDVAAAHCLLVGRIGEPIDRPALLHLELATRDGMPLERAEKRAAEIARAQLALIPRLADDFVAGTIEVF